MAKKKAVATPIRLIEIGDEVRVIQSQKRGLVEKVEAGTGLFPIITVRVEGYAARYNSNQLKRVGE